MGVQPYADDLLDDGTLAAPGERLALHVCRRCWLVQLPRDVGVPRGELHSHGGRFSVAWRQHQLAWFDSLTRQVQLRSDAHVAQFGIDDDIALRPYAQRKMEVSNWTSRASLASAIAAGERADVVLVSHALSHTDDPLGLVRDIRGCLRPGGVVSIEFHHVAELIASSQVDVVNHFHRVYLSVLSLEHLLNAVGLRIEQAERLPMYGGSVRVLVREAHESGAGDHASSVIAGERNMGLASIGGYNGLQSVAEGVRDAFRSFLERAAARGRQVVGYGAPPRGTTLLNYCGITTEDIAYTVDRNPAKQGRLLPGCRLPIREPEVIERTRPEVVVILPWPLQSEIREQLGFVRSWGGRFVVALPRLQLLD